MPGAGFSLEGSFSFGPLIIIGPVLATFIFVIIIGGDKQLGISFKRLSLSYLLREVKTSSMDFLEGLPPGLALCQAIDPSLLIEILP